MAPNACRGLLLAKLKGYVRGHTTSKVAAIISSNIADSVELTDQPLASTRCAGSGIATFLFPNVKWPLNRMNLHDSRHDLRCW